MQVGGASRGLAAPSPVRVSQRAVRLTERAAAAVKAEEEGRQPSRISPPHEAAATLQLFLKVLGA